MNKFDLFAAELTGSTVCMLRESLNREARERRWTTDRRLDVLKSAFATMYARVIGGRNPNTRTGGKMCLWGNLPELGIGADKFDLLAAELMESTVCMLRESLNRVARELRWTTDRLSEALQSALATMQSLIWDALRDVSLRIQERAAEQLEVFDANKAVDMWDEIARKWEARQK